MKDDNIGVTVLKKEFFRAIAVDLGGSGEELMKKIRKSKKIEGTRSKRRLRGRKRTGRRRTALSHGRDGSTCQRTRTSGMK